VELQLQAVPSPPGQHAAPGQALHQMKDQEESVTQDPATKTKQSIRSRGTALPCSLAAVSPRAV